MSLFELREAIERAVPWWVPFLPGLVAVAYYTVLKLQGKL